MTSYLRYKQQIRTVQDADDDIESWITVRGNHIPIKKGQSKEEAVKSFVESKGEKEKGGDYVSAGREKAKREAGHEFKKRSGVGMKFTEYEPEFEVVRKNALANGNVYGGKYTQKSKEEAYKEYKNDTSSKENMKKANEFVNGKPKDVKNTFLSNPNTLKEFANHFGISEKVAKNASEKFGDAFYHVMTKDPQAGAGIAINYEKYTKEDVEKHLEGLKQKTKESKPEPKKDKAYNTKMRELFSKHYDTLYKHAEKDVQYGDLVKEFDKKLQSDPEFKKEVQSFVKERGDVLSSDREVKAYMLARNEAKKTSANKTESEKPKSSNKTTFYKNVSGKQLWSPAWKGSGRKSGYTAIENELLTEKEMEKHGFNKESSAFKKVELGKKDHHYMFGARFETKKGDK